RQVRVERRLDEVVGLLRLRAVAPRTERTVEARRVVVVERLRALLRETRLLESVEVRVHVGDVAAERRPFLERRGLLLDRVELAVRGEHLLVVGAEGRE